MSTSPHRVQRAEPVTNPREGEVFWQTAKSLSYGAAEIGAGAAT